MKANDKKIIEIEVYKAILSIVAFFITTVIGTTFVVANVLNTDHFTLISLNSTVSAIPTTYVRQDVSETRQKEIERRLDSIDKSIRDLTQAVSGK